MHDVYLFSKILVNFAFVFAVIAYGVWIFLSFNKMTNQKKKDDNVK